jgi:hypothetical protein
MIPTTVLIPPEHQIVMPLVPAAALNDDNE